MSAILDIRDLNVRFQTEDGEVHAVKDFTLSLNAGECVGIVGESGSGKSQTFLAAMGLLAGNGRATGSVLYRGTEILNAPQSRLNRVRGSKITMIFQDPLTSLTPHMKIGRQITEGLRRHLHLSEAEARKRAFDVLELIRIPEAARRMNQYPHELSGGMRQRVMIAMATVTAPDLLIADEPTTALDVTIQAQILDIMRELKLKTNTSIVLISHDMGVIAGIADRVAVMQKGVVVEQNDTDTLFEAPAHPYTRLLLNSVSRIDKPGRAEPLPVTAETLLTVDDLQVRFKIPTGFLKAKELRAVDGVSFTLKKGETLGIVGESGCGKTTLARSVLRLAPKTGGNIVWLGRDLSKQNDSELRALRRDFQIVFQDPLASLDPRRTIGESIAEPLQTQHVVSRRDAMTKVREMMREVGLDPAWINRYPHELSGGQNQRVGIARAMIVDPKLVVCDEAVSALDVSIQSQIIDLLLELQKKNGMSLMFISHDLSVVRQISHRVMVLYLGRVVELADRDAIYNDARHPYTKALMAAVPVPDPRVERNKVHARLTGDLPSPFDSRAPLRFLKSKRIEDPDAEQYRPQLIEVSPGHLVAEYDP